ncbi:major facilitator superfamily domain-containing protein [Mycena vitilis]|nr:major facilitator superfamily domain-containing protein [Mycena vitilis]
MSDSYPLIIAQYDLVGHSTRTEHWSLAALVDKRQAYIMQIIGNSDTFLYQPRMVKSFATSRSLRGGFLVGRIPADKVHDLQNILREVTVTRYDKSFDCQTWVIDATRTPIPKLQVAIALLIQFAEPITALVIYPFVVQFVRDTGITRGEEAITGFYAGLLESAFFLAESLTVLHFGRLSDVYGRRPVLLLGPLGLTIAMLGFGLSKKFWYLFLFRCIQGVCNGNIGISFAIADSTNIADIFSMMPLMLSVGTTVAPLIGGLLADPVKKWPDTLGRFEILREHPYLLPCAVAASVALFSFVLALVGLNETLPSRRRKNTGPAETDPLLPAAPLEEHDAPPPVRDLLNRPILIALTNHGLLCLCHMANEALIPLFFATPMSLSGLGLNPRDIGLILGIFGICNALFQAFFGGRVIRRFGPRPVFTAAFCALAGQFAM